MYTADMIGIVAVFSLLAKFAIGQWIMAIPSSSTFRYLTTVPEGGTHACPWKMESRETLKATGDPLDDNRLVGWNPLLQISDAGVTPNPGPARPAVVRSELRLVATDKEHASQLTASFSLDKALVNALRPGDIFHMAQSACCGLGFSAIRQGKLIFAVGQISAVPLGSGIQVRTPLDLVEEAQEVFRQRDPGIPECVAISLDEACDWVAASASSQLLEMCE